MTSFLDTLEASAKAATPGKWSLDGSQGHALDLLADERTTSVSAYFLHDPEVGIFGDPDGAGRDMAYIALCQPSNILALVRVAEEAINLIASHPDATDEFHELILAVTPYPNNR